MFLKACSNMDGLVLENGGGRCRHVVSGSTGALSGGCRQTRQASHHVLRGDKPQTSSTRERVVVFRRFDHSLARRAGFETASSNSSSATDRIAQRGGRISSVCLLLHRHLRESDRKNVPKSWPDLFAEYALVCGRPTSVSGSVLDQDGPHAKFHVTRTLGTQLWLHQLRL